MKHFEKWQALGNDFIIVEGGGLHHSLCNRNFGIGADGILEIHPSQVALAKMKVINADGSEAEMCGNGIRCAAKYLTATQGWAMGKEEVSFDIETAAGLKTVRLAKNGNVSVDMGRAHQIWQKPLPVCGKTYDATFISIGNPHCVLFTDPPSDSEVEAVGSALEHNRELFKEGANVEFVSLSSNQLIVRVWERGVGRTLACGTGACASAFAAYLRGKVGPHVVVRLDGGTLEIELNEAGIIMSGAAEKVFEGEVM